MKIYVRLIISRAENKTINYLKRNSNDFKIQLARKFRTDVLSLYRKMSSLGAPGLPFGHVVLEHNVNKHGRNRSLVPLGMHAFLLPGIPRTEKLQGGGGLEVGNRSVKTERILTPATFKTEPLAKVSGGAADVYNLIGPVRRLPLYFYAGLGFKVENRRCMYLVLPFGLMTAPWVFTQVV